MQGGGIVLVANVAFETPFACDEVVCDFFTHLLPAGEAAV